MKNFLKPGNINLQPQNWAINRFIQATSLAAFLALTWCDWSSTSSDDPQKITGKLQTSGNAGDATLVFESVGWQRIGYSTETDRRWEFEINVDELRDEVDTFYSWNINYKDIIVRARIGENNLIGNVRGNPTASITLDSVWDELNINTATSVHADLIRHGYENFAFEPHLLNRSERETVRETVSQRLSTTLYEDEYMEKDMDDFTQQDVYEYNQDRHEIVSDFDYIVQYLLDEQYRLESDEVSYNFREQINLARFSLKESSWNKWLEITPHFEWSQIYYRINDTYKLLENYIWDQELNKVMDWEVIEVIEVNEDNVSSTRTYIYYDNWNFFVEHRWFREKL